MDDTTLVRVLKAVGHPKRFHMVREIADAGELSCGQIGGRFGVSQPTISHHLKILADAGVLVCRESGQHRIISVNLPLLREVARFLPGQVSAGPQDRRAGAVRSRPRKERARARPVQRIRRP